MKFLEGIEMDGYDLGHPAYWVADLKEALSTNDLETIYVLCRIGHDTRGMIDDQVASDMTSLIDLLLAQLPALLSRAEVGSELAIVTVMMAIELLEAMQGFLLPKHADALTWYDSHAVLEGNLAGLRIEFATRLVELAKGNKDAASFKAAFDICQPEFRLPNGDLNIADMIQFGIIE